MQYISTIRRCPKMLFALLNSVVSEADLLAAIIFGRIVTVSGDILFYLSALVMKSRTVKTA